MAAWWLDTEGNKAIWQQCRQQLTARQHDGTMKETAWLYNGQRIEIKQCSAASLAQPGQHGSNQQPDGTSAMTQPSTANGKHTTPAMVWKTAQQHNGTAAQ
jgi:hypothetical protein